MESMLGLSIGIVIHQSPFIEELLMADADTRIGIMTAQVFCSKAKPRFHTFLGSNLPCGLVNRCFGVEPRHIVLSMAPLHSPRRRVADDSAFSTKRWNKVRFLALRRCPSHIVVAVFFPDRHGPKTSNLSYRSRNSSGLMDDHSARPDIVALWFTISGATGDCHSRPPLASSLWLGN